MPRPHKVPHVEPPIDVGPLTYPCDRCEVMEARRWGVATVMGGRGGRQARVGLCDPCAAACAAPGAMRSSLGGVEHGFGGDGRRR